MTEYRQQAEGPPPAIEPSAPPGSRDNPLPFRVFKKCPLCGDGPTGCYGLINKNVIRRHDGVLLLEHRHSGSGCSGTWHTRTALDEKTTTVRGGGTAAEMIWPWRIVLLASVGVILAIGVFFGLLLGGV